MIALEKLNRKNTTKRWDIVTRRRRSYLKTADNRLNVSVATVSSFKHALNCFKLEKAPPDLAWWALKLETAALIE
jgi:hypothetical protein